MPLYLWILIEPGQHARDTEEGGTKDIRDIEDVLLHWKKEGAHRITNPLTNPPHQEEHASNVAKWATLLETAQGRGNRRISISWIAKTKDPSIFPLSYWPKIMWLR